MWVSQLILALLYFGVAKLGLLMAIRHPSVSPIWPASGLAVAALLLRGYRTWPGVMLGAFLADVSTPPETPGIALGIAVGNTAEGLLAAFLIRRMIGPVLRFDRPPMVAKFTAITMISCLVAATNGTFILCAGGAGPCDPFWPLWATWWLGDGVGILVMTPLLLAWSEKGLLKLHEASGHMLLLWGMLAALGQLIFSGWLPTGVRHYPISYLILLPLMWIGLFNRLRMTTTAMLFIAAFTLWGTRHGFGPFAGWNVLETAIQLQVYLMASSIVGLGTAAFSCERHATETTFRKRAFMLKTMVDNASESVFIKNMDGRYLLANQAAASFMGRPLSEIVGARDEDLVDQETLRSVRTIESRALASGMAQTEEIDDKQEGKERTFAVIKYPFLDPEGTMQGTVGIYRDITERRQLEKSLQRGYALLQALQETTLDGVLVTNEQHQVVRLNRRFQELTGLPPMAFESGGDQALLDHAIATIADPDAFMQKIRYLYAHPQESSRDLIQLKDGRTLSRYSAPAVSPQGEYFGRVWFLRDITESKQLEEALRANNQQLQQLDYLKDLFLSSISHEMKTPLSLITGYAELLEDKYPGDELVAGILDGSWRLSEHLTKILDYSALLASSMPLYRTEVCLRESTNLVQEIITADPDFRSKQLKFQLDIEPGTPPVYGDSRRISQIMLELLENSIKFTPAGGSIGVRIAATNGTVRLEVWDTGPGISSADLEQLGQAFTHLEKSSTIRTGGLGLGLSIVKKLVELHGGTLEIQSQPGQGTTVIVLLPRQDTPRP